MDLLYWVKMFWVVLCGNYYIWFVIDIIFFGNCYFYLIGSIYMGSYDMVFLFICLFKKFKNVDVLIVEVDVFISDMFFVNLFVCEVLEECISEE